MNVFSIFLLLNISEGQTSTLHSIITFWLIKLVDEEKNQIRNTFLWHDIVK